MDSNRLLTSVKILELSIETRKELREKMASFFGTIAKEDKVQED